MIKLTTLTDVVSTLLNYLILKSIPASKVCWLNITPVVPVVPSGCRGRFSSVCGGGGGNESGSWLLIWEGVPLDSLV